MRLLRLLSRKFGWCIDGTHSECRIAYRDWNNQVQECSCSCHEGKPKPDTPEVEPVWDKKPVRKTRSKKS